ncbi:unnamed protein product [Symbiodinium sp. CCMP2592]|nr:unnamed protein product [Symbiodinium sp. CCMP2592]
MCRCAQMKAVASAMNSKAITGKELKASSLDARTCCRLIGRSMSSMFDVLAAIFVPEKTEDRQDLKTMDRWHRTHRSRRMSAESHRPVLSLVGTAGPCHL